MNGKFKKIRRITPLVFVVPLFIFVWSCTYVNGVSTMVKGDHPVTFSRIAVIPFQTVSMDDAPFKVVSCPVCGLVFNAEKVPSEAAKIIEDLFIDSLKKYSKLVVIPPERVEGIYARLVQESHRVNMTQILKKLGSELDVDAVVFAYVYRFRERKGFAYSVEKPASVSFEIHLIQVSDGSLVWRGIFDRTQRSLMENVLFISTFYREGAQWITARELAKEGMSEVMKSFPLSSE